MGEPEPNLEEFFEDKRPPRNPLVPVAQVKDLKISQHWRKRMQRSHILLHFSSLIDILLARHFTKRHRPARLTFPIPNYLIYSSSRRSPISSLPFADSLMFRIPAGFGRSEAEFGGLLVSVGG
ncbi:hypothetical protein CRG98_046358 [Punica granatum]|uniref:Uncharacterized protein n=1 Tax=Punica granatum TaxID=22663 RepID=A0A2I0HNE1_PUNGR|nr:hypothetical protein CRG98_046358 [Punica granatum]